MLWCRLAEDIESRRDVPNIGMLDAAIREAVELRRWRRGSRSSSSRRCIAVPEDCTFGNEIYGRVMQPDGADGSVDVQCRRTATVFDRIKSSGMTYKLGHKCVMKTAFSGSIATRRNGYV